MANITVPILGVVENMAWFSPPELPQNKYYLFGKDGGQQLADELKVPVLGRIPIVESIREGGDTGNPVMLDQTNPVQEAWEDLVFNTARYIAIRNEELQPTKKWISNTPDCVVPLYDNEFRHRHIRAG